MKDFESNLATLEQLTNDIKRTDISLEDALKDFEEGIQLARGMEKEIDKIDFSRSILLYSQTTMNSSDYDKVAEKIAETITSKKSCIMFKKFDTVCRSVAGREKKLEGFAAHFDAILFVAGANSSNGKYLYTSCKNVNPNTYYISSEKDFEPQMFSKVKKLGITGATSTPKWLLQRVAEAAAKI